jgi:hypothetical protein
VLCGRVGFDAIHHYIPTRALVTDSGSSSGTS